MIFTFVLYNIVLVVSSFLLWFKTKTRSSASQAVVVALAFFVLFIPAALRYNIAEDYIGYVSIYHRILQGDRTYVEVGFYWLIKAIQYLGLDVQYLFIITSFVIYYFLLKSYRNFRHSWLINIAFCLIVYLETYSLIRSSIVLGLTMYAIEDYIVTHRLRKSLFIVFLSTLIHRSAITLLPVFILLRMSSYSFKEAKSIRAFSLLVIVCLFVFRYDFVSFVLSIGIIELIGFDKYLSNDLYMSTLEYNTGLGLLSKFFLLILPLFIYDYIELEQRRKRVYFMLIYICAISLILSSVIFVFLRLNYLFVFGYFYSLVMLYSIRILWLSKVLGTLFAIYYFFSFQFFIFNNTSDKCASTRVSPYVSILNKQDDNSLKVDNKTKLDYEECVIVYGDRK